MGGNQRSSGSPRAGGGGGGGGGQSAEPGRCRRHGRAVRGVSGEMAGGGGGGGRGGAAAAAAFPLGRRGRARPVTRRIRGGPRRGRAERGNVGLRLPEAAPGPGRWGDGAAVTGQRRAPQPPPVWRRGAGRAGGEGERGQRKRKRKLKISGNGISALKRSVGAR